MATISKAKSSKDNDPIMQGDIYKKVKYSYIDSENESAIDIIEFEFPLAVIISQACDVLSMEKILNKKIGKATKFMPSILLCPIYDKDIAKTSNLLKSAFNELGLTLEEDNMYQKDDYKVALRDWHYRFHAMEIDVMDKKELNISDAIIDFKHYFSVPMSYLISNRKNRICHLDDLFAEQLSLKFATYLSRVAIPD